MAKIRALQEKRIGAENCGKNTAKSLSVAFYFKILPKMFNFPNSEKKRLFYRSFIHLMYKKHTSALRVGCRRELCTFSTLESVTPACYVFYWVC